MNTIEEFKKVLSTFGKFANFEDKIKVQSSYDVNCKDGGEKVFIVDMYTDRNVYNIKAIERENDLGYLGCVASKRKPNAGECNTRGNDLADGSLSTVTWHQILCDIVSYELVPLFKPAKLQTIEAETTCAQLK